MKEFELFEQWAVKDGAWSPWVKPVLFAAPPSGGDEARSQWSAAVERARARWTPPRPGETALVLDLPGADALALGVECASHGYRPVPLFNSCLGPNAIVPNEALRAGLELGIGALAAARLHADAPPSFVLDARRLQGEAKPLMFDNRWLVFPQDFPSANVLLGHGIRRIILVQDGRDSPRTDLSHVLLRWQRAGIAIDALNLAAAEPAPIALQVAAPSWFMAAFYRVLATLKLRRNSAGGFGAVVPEVTSSGGGFS